MKFTLCIIFTEMNLIKICFFLLMLWVITPTNPIQHFFSPVATNKNGDSCTTFHLYIEVSNSKLDYICSYVNMIYSFIVLILGIFRLILYYISQWFYNTNNFNQNIVLYT